MMIMEPFEVYRSYLALRLHFTTDAYDVIKQRGKVKASKQAFFKRKDLLAIRRVSEQYSDSEVVNFLVANFVSGDRWGGVFDVDAKDRYTLWKKRIESMSYTFEKEVAKLCSLCHNKNINFSELFVVSNSQHPYILKMYLRQDVSIETLVILDQLKPYTNNLDIELADDVVWPDVSRIIKKYTPFLTFSRDRYYGILRRAIGSSE